MQEPQETRVGSLGGEDPLEQGTATHSSILACRIPWTEEPGGLQSILSQRVGYDWSDLAHMQKEQGKKCSNKNCQLNSALFPAITEFTI